VAAVVRDLRRLARPMLFDQSLVQFARCLLSHGVKPLGRERTSQIKPANWNRNLATEFPHNRDAWRMCAAQAVRLFLS
jgi:hypothetical protein